MPNKLCMFREYQEVKDYLLMYDAVYSVLRKNMLVQLLKKVPNIVFTKEICCRHLEVQQLFFKDLRKVNAQHPHTPCCKPNPSIIYQGLTQIHWQSKRVKPKEVKKFQ